MKNTKSRYDLRSKSFTGKVGDKVLYRGRSQTGKLSNQWSGPYEMEALDEPNATLKNPRGELFMVHIENLSIPSKEPLASGKEIPSSRKRPHASTQG